MKRAGVLVALALAALLLGCQTESEPTFEPIAPTTPQTAAPQAAKTTVAVTGRPLQRIDAWGASVVVDTWVDPLLVPEDLSAAQLRRLDELVFRKAGVTLVRVFGPGYGSEQENPGPPRADDVRFAFMRRVSPYGVRFMLTGAAAPAAMTDGDRLVPGREADYAGYLLSLLRFADQEVGVPFAYSAIANEPDNPNALLEMSREQAALVYAELARLIREAGLKTKLVLGDNTTWDRAVQYVESQVADQRVRGAAAAVASHAYGGDVEDQRALFGLARTRRLPVWQTEWGNGCAECPNDPTMKSALPWSLEIASALTEAQTNAWFAFRAVADSTHGPGDALIVRQRGDSEEPFFTTKRFHVFRQYTWAAPPGSRRVAVRARADDVVTVAFRRRGAISAVLTNAADGPAMVGLDLGPDAGRMQRRRTGDHEDFRALPALRYRGRPVALELPADSVTTVLLRGR